MYLTFDDYKRLGGNTYRKQHEFTRMEYVARKNIEFHTSGRLKGIFPVPEELELCVIELIDRGYCKSYGIKDSKRQSYEGASESHESINGKAAELIRNYLSSISVPVFSAGERLAFMSTGKATAKNERIPMRKNGDMTQQIYYIPKKYIDRFKWKGFAPVKTRSMEEFSIPMMPKYYVSHPNNNL